MILELADFTIPVGKNAEFEEAIRRGIATVVSKAKASATPRCTAASSRPSATC